jgi:hypothetical protein
MTAGSSRICKGHSWPGSATGSSSLAEPPPHHVSSYSIRAKLRRDPVRITSLLPPGLEPLDSGDGWRMIAGVAKVSTSRSGLMWRDPARSSYNKCVLGVFGRSRTVLVAMAPSSGRTGTCRSASAPFSAGADGLPRSRGRGRKRSTGHEDGPHSSSASRSCRLTFWNFSQQAQ